VYEEISAAPENQYFLKALVKVLDASLLFVCFEGIVFCSSCASTHANIQINIPRVKRYIIYYL
jgi:hypothetical protein